MVDEDDEQIAKIPDILQKYDLLSTTKSVPEIDDTTSLDQAMIDANKLASSLASFELPTHCHFTDSQQWIR